MSFLKKLCVTAFLLFSVLCSAQGLLAMNVQGCFLEELFQNSGVEPETQAVIDRLTTIKDAIQTAMVTEKMYQELHQILKDAIQRSVYSVTKECLAVIEILLADEEFGECNEWCEGLFREVGKDIDLDVDTLLKNDVSYKTIFRLFKVFIGYESLLDLSGCELTNNKLELVIKALGKYGNLVERLNLQGNFIQQDGIKPVVFWALHNNKSKMLTNLDGLSQECVWDLLCEVAYAKNVDLVIKLLVKYELCLSSYSLLNQTKVKNLLISLGAAVRHNFKVLFDNGVSCQAIIRLIKFILAKDSALDLSGCGLTKEQLMAVIMALGQRARLIEELNLMDNAITALPENMGELSALKKLHYDSATQITGEMPSPKTLSDWINNFNIDPTKCESSSPVMSEANSPTFLQNIPKTLSPRELGDMFVHASELYLQELSQQKYWSSSIPDQFKNFDSMAKLYTEKAILTPYTQKLMVEKGSKICFMGDLHGSIHSLLRNLHALADMGYLNDDFEINQQQDHPFYMIFLGDYVDRGRWSVEVLYILMQLKMKNPDRVFLLKGNHEQYDANSRYGFANELTIKYPQEARALLFSYNAFFEFLPCALYLGVQGDDGKRTFIQCCHGGIEPHYNPKALLLGHDAEKKFDFIANESESTPTSQTIKELTSCITRPEGKTILDNGVGFTWGDYINAQYKEKVLLPDDLRVVNIPFNSAVSYLDALNEELVNARVCALFRGHQHNFFGLKIQGDDHWSDFFAPSDARTNGFSLEALGPVFTFSTAREGVGLPYDCFGILTVAEDFKDWRLRPYECLLDESIDLGVGKIAQKM